MSRPEVLLWAALYAVQLAPVWGLRYFPSQDGPSHLENANILLLLRRPELPVFREYYVVNSKPTPNWLGHLALAGLIHVAGPLPAEKILLTLYILTMPLAVRYALQASAPLAILSFPFLYNCLLHYGFYNFCLSIALFFVAIGYWRRRDRWRWRESAALAAILLLLYGCHVVSWALALLALAIFAPRSTGWLALAALPSGVLAALFFLGRPGGVAGVAVPFAARGRGLLRFTTSVYSYAPLHQWVGAAFALILVCLAIASPLRRAPMVLSASILLLYFATPAQAFGGMFLLERLNLYFFISLLLWINTDRRIANAAALVFTVTLLALNWPWYREANRLIADYLSGVSTIPANSVFLPLVYDPRGAGPMRELYGEPLRHTASYAAVLRSAVNLDNYEAQTDLFPVMFQPARNPAVFVGAMEENPPKVRLDSARIDYLLYWDPMRAAPLPPARFTQLFTSAGGAMRIFGSR